MSSTITTLPTMTRNPNLSFLGVNSTGKNEILQRFGERWWTGTAPEKTMGFSAKDQALHALPLLNTRLASRQDVLDYFDNTWTLTEVLFSALKKDEAYTRPPYHQLRHPLIFYYGHTAVLFINKLRLAGLFHQPIDLYLEKVLETGVDEMRWDDMSKNEMNWPSVEAVHAYRKKVYNVIKDVILNHPAFDEGDRGSIHHPFWSVWMGLEHEKIHFETSSVLMRELPLELVETPKYWPALCHSQSKIKNQQPLSWKTQTATEVKLGKDLTTPSFGWDNEYGERIVQLKDFQYTKTLISNAEYYDFVKSGSYSEDQYWSTEGLQWRKFRNTKRPTFWMASGPEGLHEYKLRTIFSVIDMPWDWPVEVNFHEAQAYCRWKQEQDRSSLHYRLFTEAEYTLLRRNEKRNDPVLQTQSYRENKNLKTDSSNFNFVHSSPSPVDEKMDGNVWHWLEDQFNPLEGFKVHSLYDDFSTPCFDGKHQMILGGSFISCGHEASIWARFHFRPHFYQHSGFRMAASLDGSKDNSAFKFRDSQEYIHQRRENILEQIEQPNWWKQVRQPLQLNTQENHQIFETAKKYVVDFLENFTSQKAGGQPGVTVPYQSTKNFPDRSQDLDSLLKSVFKELAPLSQMPGHPRYAAYLAGSTNSLSAVAQWMATVLNPFTGHYSFAPGFVQIEAEAIKWFSQLFNYPEKTALGFFTSGGSYANLSALSLARHHRLQQEDYAKAKIYASAQAHHCFNKALSFLGFPTTAFEAIPVDDQFAMNTVELKKKIEEDIKKGFKPLMIIGTAGTTTTGAIDPLEEIAQIAEKYQIWYHVDGAFGAAFQLTKKGKSLLKGIEKSDSLSLDPHKSMSMPYGTGLLLVRDRKHLLYQYNGSKTYMPDENFYDESGLKVDFSEISPELSREWRGFKVWLPLKFFGIAPIVLNLEEKLELTQWFYQELKQIREIHFAASPQLTVQAFRLNLGSDEKNDRATLQLLELINQSGLMFLSGCTLNGRKHIRVSLLSHQMHFAEVEALAKNLPQIVKKVIDQEKAHA